MVMSRQHMRNFPKSACCVSSPERAKPAKAEPQLSDTQTIILESSDSFEESKEVLDIAFTQLPPDAASPIEAHAASF